MGTRGLEIVCFRGRYYIRYHQYDSYFEGLGANVVTSIPADPDEYQKWLESKRAEYAATERALEQYVYGSHEPDYSQPLCEWEALPSELPRLDGYGAEYFYIINLDHEVLTMNFSIHWKLGNIPRQDNLWLRAIVDSIYEFKPTISLDACPEEHMASLALELPDHNSHIGYDFREVTARTDIGDARKVVLARVAAEALIVHKNEIIRFGASWSPTSFPFRELAFALVSITSGQAHFLSFDEKSSAHRDLTRSPGWIDEGWAGVGAPLLEFGSMCHRPGAPPGASPTETMYWLEDVLVSLTLVVDGEAVTAAVTWGIEQGHTNFQIVVMSLFEVTFAEVSSSENNGSPFVKVSPSIDLSPLSARCCVSTHPRERPERKDGMEPRRQRGELIRRSNCTGTARRLRGQFPGLAALVNFFDVAASRRAASKSVGLLPAELYGRILDFVDYDTWKACSVVSPEFRSYTLLKYRLDGRMRILGGPFVRLGRYRNERLLSFDFENMETGEILPMMGTSFRLRRHNYDWMPVIGSDRKALMVDVVVRFTPAMDVPVEADSDDESG
ncbi:Uncharacterized protein TPAR_08673 [Tolypocladium paradoxum]|uniref:F-box domain-containing protein n=1 Tax=Tolypocladium paradoxum TaxID=94208 RepID=A0A2S4KLP5_9HYPO|nr:Uncharacterized protein TPAR_08673 [Tolypocladium paradoxum]